MYSAANFETLAGDRHYLIRLSQDRPLTEQENARLAELNQTDQMWRDNKRIAWATLEKFKNYLKPRVAQVSAASAMRKNMEDMVNYCSGFPEDLEQVQEFKNTLEGIRYAKFTGSWNRHAEYQKENYSFLIPHTTGKPLPATPPIYGSGPVMQYEILKALQINADITQYEVRTLTPLHFTADPSGAGLRVRLDDQNRSVILPISVPETLQAVQDITQRNFTLREWAVAHRMNMEEIPFFCDIADPLEAGEDWWDKMIQASGLYFPATRRLLALRGCRDWITYRQKLMNGNIHTEYADAQTAHGVTVQAL